MAEEEVVPKFAVAVRVAGSHKANYSGSYHMLALMSVGAFEIALHFVWAIGLEDSDDGAADCKADVRPSVVKIGVAIKAVVQWRSLVRQKSVVVIGVVGSRLGLVRRAAAEGLIQAIPSV